MLAQRGFSLEIDPVEVSDGLASSSAVAVFNHGDAGLAACISGYANVPQLIDHGVKIIVLCDAKDVPELVDARFVPIGKDYPWKEKVVFIPDLQGVRLDEITTYDPGSEWDGTEILLLGNYEPLNHEQKLLVDRAFPKAEEIHIRPLEGGFTESRVFMAYERRRESSISHWTQPRLVKIGSREALAREVKAMREVSPFVPFELRPNLEFYIEGFRSSVLVADFVDKSDSLIDAARAGRAETAISNLFNRTLNRWRERAWRCDLSNEPLASAAMRLDMFKVEDIQREYLNTQAIEDARLDFYGLWNELQAIAFKHRAATIHGDLHGDNVRVRGDDAILIDLGAVKGTDEPGKGAPLCFDVAMLDVALVFACTKADEDCGHSQETWEEEILPYYKLQAILSTPAIDGTSKLNSWLHGCLQRLRAFGIYDQSDRLEYPIAVAIALWRWAKFESRSQADKRRRVVALITGARLLKEILATKQQS
ncbi:MAG: hypothetical protein AABY95_03660 [Pseudomonadota bacterium]